jgi:hypothetical protein
MCYVKKRNQFSALIKFLNTETKFEISVRGGITIPAGEQKIHGPQPNQD